MADLNTQERPGAVAERDRGTTFVEIVVSIVLIGTVVIAILAAVRTAVQASAMSREAAQVETAILNASDRVSRAPIKCLAGEYEPFADAAIAVWEGDGTTEVAVSHYVYDDNLGAFAAGTWNPGSPCPTDVTQKTIQLVDITITGPDRGVVRSIQVVKGDV